MMMCFFFNDTATTEIYTLSLHDALPISGSRRSRDAGRRRPPGAGLLRRDGAALRRAEVGECRRPDRAVALEAAADRKSTRLNSSHANLVCRLLLEKKNTSELHRLYYLVC